MLYDVHLWLWCFLARGNATQGCSGSGASLKEAMQPKASTQSVHHQPDRVVHDVNISPKKSFSQGHKPAQKPGQKKKQKAITKEKEKAKTAADKRREEAVAQRGI